MNYAIKYSIHYFKYEWQITHVTWYGVESHYSYFTETQVVPSSFNGSLGAGTTVTVEEQERLSTPLHVCVDPVSFLHRNDTLRLMASLINLPLCF